MKLTDVVQFTNLKNEKAGKPKELISLDTFVADRALGEEIADETVRAWKADNMEETVDGFVDAAYYILNALFERFAPGTIEDLWRRELAGHVNGAFVVEEVTFDMYVDVEQLDTGATFSVEDFTNLALLQCHLLNDRPDRVVHILYCVNTALLRYLRSVGVCEPARTASAVFTLVHKANMTKFGPGGHLDEATHKWIKPPDFVSPDADIRKLLHNALTSSPAPPQGPQAHTSS